MPNKTENRTLTKNQHTKSMPDLHSKNITKKNNSRSSSVLREEDTDSTISEADTRASINGDYSDAEENIQKTSEIDLIAQIAKLSYGSGGGKPEDRYTAAVNVTMKYLTQNVSIAKKYKQFNEDDLFNAIKKVAGLDSSKNDTGEFGAMKKKFKSNETGKNILNMLTGGSETKALETENLNLQQQMAEDRKKLEFEAEKAKQEAQQALQENSVLKGQVGNVDSQLKQEQKAKEQLEEQKKTAQAEKDMLVIEKQEKEEALKKKEAELKEQKDLVEKQSTTLTDLELQMEQLKEEQLKKKSEIEELQTKIRDSEGKPGTEKSDLQRQIDKLMQENEDLALEGRSLKANLNEAERDKQSLEGKVQDAGIRLEEVELERQRIEREKNYALQQAIEKLNLQNQQSEQEKRSQADILNAEKLKNDKLPAEVETNKGLAEEKEKGQNQPNQQSQRKDITFEPDSAKDKISERAKAIGRAFEGNGFIIATIIGIALALMSGAALAVVIVAAVTPMAGMMVNKGINIIGDQIERSQKNKEREQILELNQQRFLNQQQGLESQTIAQGKYGIETQNNRQAQYKGGQEEEFNDPERDESESTKESEVDSIGANNAKNGSEFDEMGEIDNINKETKKAKLGNLEDEEFDVEQKFNLDSSKKDEISPIDLKKKHSNIEGLDLDGAIDPMTKINNPGNLTFEEQRAQLKAKVGYSPTLQTSEQVNASETKSDRGINVDDIKIKIKEDANVVQVLEFTEVEQKDNKIGKLAKEYTNVASEQTKHQKEFDNVNTQSNKLKKGIDEKNAKENELLEQQEDLKTKMEKLGMNDESEKKTGLFGSQTKRDKDFKEQERKIDLKIVAFQAQQKSNEVKLTKPNIDAKEQKKYEEKIVQNKKDITNANNEKNDLQKKYDEQNGIKKQMEEKQKEIANNTKEKDALTKETKELEAKKATLEKQISNTEEKKEAINKKINDRKLEVKKEAAEKKAKEEQKKAHEVQKKYEKDLKSAKEAKAKAKKAANLDKNIKDRAYMESANEDKLFGLIPQQEKIGFNDKNQKEANVEEKNAGSNASSQPLEKTDSSKIDFKPQQSFKDTNDLLENSIKDLNFSGVSDTHSVKNFVVDAKNKNSRSSGTSSHIQ